jgi:hypothetical protein
MWPFDKKIVPVEDPNASLTIQIKEMASWRGIGETFDYLGRKCAVTGYHDIIPCGWPPIRVPRLKANYADDLGVIHSLSLSYCDFLELKNRDAADCSNQPD